MVISYEVSDGGEWCRFCQKLHEPNSEKMQAHEVLCEVLHARIFKLSNKRKKKNVKKATTTSASESAYDDVDDVLAWIEGTGPDPRAAASPARESDAPPLLDNLSARDGDAPKLDGGELSERDKLSVDSLGFFGDMFQSEDGDYDVDDLLAWIEGTGPDPRVADSPARESDAPKLEDGELSEREGDAPSDKLSADSLGFFGNMFQSEDDDEWDVESKRERDAPKLLEPEDDDDEWEVAMFANIMAREEAVAERENMLAFVEDNFAVAAARLAEREKVFVERESDLVARSTSILEWERGLSEREKTLLESEKAFVIEHNDLMATRGALARDWVMMRDQRLGFLNKNLEFEKEVIQREKEVLAREGELMAREEELLAREKALERK